MIKKRNTMDRPDFLGHPYTSLFNPDGRLKDEIRTFIEGMSVSVDVSTSEEDAGRRYYGTVSEVMDDELDKHRVILLVQNNVRPNFDPIDLDPNQKTLLRRLLIAAQIGTCSCRTKSHEYVYHALDCQYRTAVELELILLGPEK